MLLNVLFSKGRKLGRPSVPMLNLDSPKRERTPAKGKPLTNGGAEGY